MLLLSIHPKYVDLILAGEKQFELRRRKPRIKTGTAIIYASSPRMQLVATLQVSSVITGSSGMLWKVVQHSCGVTRTEFDRYFHGVERGVALRIGDVQPISPIPLADLRAIWPGFHPPQGYLYIDQERLDKLPGLRRAA